MGKILSGAALFARGAAALAGLSVMLVLALVGILVMLAVVAGMFALPSRGPSRTGLAGSPADSRRPAPSVPALRS